MVTQINQDQFKKEVLDSQQPVFVDFFAEWCGPCKMTEPIVEEISKEMTNLKFFKVDVDQNQDLVGQYSIFSIPTFMIFKNGQIANQFIGAMGKEGFLAEIQKATS